MRTFIIVVSLLCSAAVAEQRVDGDGKPCEDLVDLSESGQFHRLHFECEPDTAPVTTYTSEALPTAKVDAAAVDVPPAGTEFLLRAHWHADQPVTGALASLYEQMRRHCPAGWDKQAEWVEPEARRWYVHARIRCRGA